MLGMKLMIVFFYSVFYCSVTLKEVKAFLPRIDCKISTNKLREAFQEVDTRNHMELGYDDFAVLYHKLIFNDNVSQILYIKKKK